ncbi:MAG: chloride channel protein [Clostridia bacterium]|nr:chloride channel protein [Clostridia bacterium]
METFSVKLISYIKIVLLSIVIGAVGGGVGSLFFYSVEFVTELRAENNWLIYLLPAVGVVTASVYKLAGLKGISTNRVLESVRSESSVPARLAPVMFLCTAMTHLCGGSAGREGAALQIGGGIATFFSDRFKVNENTRRTLIQCGMAALFSALFGTPFGAAVFALEVVCIGRIRICAVVPCAVSSATAYFIAHISGVTAERFLCETIPGFSFVLVLKVLLIAVLASLVCMLFCKLLHVSEHYALKWIKNEFLRAFVLGIIIVVISVLLGTSDYNGGGIHVISRIFTHGEFRYEAFAIKILLTVLTVAGGYKGGEIIPSLFIGATFGALCGSLIGLDVAFAAALGAVTVFCGVTNCLVASILISIELFGFWGVGYYVVCCIISFVLTNKIGIFIQDRISLSQVIELLKNRKM